MQINPELEIDDIVEDDYLGITANSSTSTQVGNTSYINKQDAIKTIRHLVKLFHIIPIRIYDEKGD